MVKGAEDGVTHGGAAPGVDAFEGLFQFGNTVGEILIQIKIEVVIEVDDESFVLPIAGLHESDGGLVVPGTSSRLKTDSFCSTLSSKTRKFSDLRPSAKRWRSSRTVVCKTTRFTSTLILEPCLAALGSWPGGGGAGVGIGI